MQKFLEATGESRDAAIANALRQLGLDRDDVSVEVLDNGKKGIFGIGAQVFQLLCRQGDFLSLFSKHDGYNNKYED